MNRFFSKKIFWLTLLVFPVFFTWQCDDPQPLTEYASLSDTVAYVGIESCRQCHLDKFNSFTQTGMGLSFDSASTMKSSARFGDTLVDSFLDLSYYPFWSEDSLFVEEMRFRGNDLVHQRLEKIDYIIGSGQHTNSHLIHTNGYVHQAPFTYYTQSGKLDLPPGFENGQNSRFSRKVGLECMSCHNAMPVNFVMGSENKFDKVPLGIDCERCHGPGEAHVNQLLEGVIIDTSKSIDYSIVNPSKLSMQLQFEICQRCHLQGNSVLKEGKSFMDFRPGMVLSDVMDIYLPRYSNSEDAFIMASHVDRFKLSECYKSNPESFGCTSCHNPHVSIKETNINSFNAVCGNCHDTKSDCSEDISKIRAEKNNCVKCHMPSSGSIDIPHVSVHDHYIRKIKYSNDSTAAAGEFIQLVAVNNDNPTKESRLMAYLQQYEKFEANPVLLDTADIILKKIDLNDLNYISERILFNHLRELPNANAFIVDKLGLENILELFSHSSYDNKDAWSLYRLSESLKQLYRNQEAVVLMEQAILLAPFNLEFRNKLGSLYTVESDYRKAKVQFEFILSEYSNSVEALSNLGYIHLLEGNLVKGESLIERSLKLDPDYSQAKLNLASAYIMLQKKSEAEVLLRELLINDPENQQIINALNYLDQL